MTIRVKSSPCIGFCSTTYGDNICRGCFRNLDEVLHWRQKSPEEKMHHYNRLSRQSLNIIEVYWRLSKSEELTEKLIQENEIFPPPIGLPCPYFSLFQLLQKGINPLTNYAPYITWNTQEMCIFDFSRLVSRFIYISNENAL